MTRVFVYRNVHRADWSVSRATTRRLAQPSAAFVREDTGEPVDRADFVLLDFAGRAWFANRITA